MKLNDENAKSRVMQLLLLPIIELQAGVTGPN